MDKQRHLIKREVFELDIASAEQAQSLQAEVSRIHRQRIVPLIDRLCDELSAADRLHRLDVLELDLGNVDSSRLEEELVEKIGSALRDSLSTQIRQQDKDGQQPGGSAKTASQLELFSRFVRKGVLPWWADLSQTRLPEDSLDYLLQDAPAALRRLLPELLRENAALQRLIRHFDDASLSKLVGLAQPSLGEFSSGLFQALFEAGSGLTGRFSLPLSRLRGQLWKSILQTAVLSVPPPENYNAFFEGTTIRWAIVLGISHTELLGRLSETVGYAARTDHPSAVSEEEGTHSIPRTDVGKLSGAELEHGPITWTEWLSTISDHLPDPLKSQFLARLGSVHNLGLAELLAQTAQKLGYTMRTADSETPAEPELSETVGYAVRTDHPSAVSEEEGTHSVPYDLAESGFSGGITDILSPNREGLGWGRAKSAASLLSNSNTDEIYLGNAGLVILWPFLKPFFDRLGLLEENHFCNDDARQRGVALLQYLVNEDVAPPEYLLPLNKLLCGMGLDAVFDLEHPLTITETDECDMLLEAVVAQAPILNNMSIGGFRGSFLFRQGILSTRDGAWLLRVERETYDLVLDRFPWGFAWVKLPWMELPLRVEW